MEIAEITVLCKVIDNYGDIGVAHRLCMELADKVQNIRLVTNNLDAYRSICPNIKNEAVQHTNGITVLNWNNGDLCKKEYTARPPAVILQCFQCGYPQWLEDILFAPSPSSRPLAPVETLVIDIDYLTAEDWADGFHKMLSLTRSSRVQKYLFMPGFTPSTGGLLFKGRTARDKGDSHPAPPSAPASPPSSKTSIFVFGYARDYRPLVRALLRSNETLPLKVYAANGAGQKSFLDACNECKKEGIIAHKLLDVTALPFLSQAEWDKLLLSSDIAFVRGEDSLAGAALAGIPFVWQAYKQEGGVHKKKTAALLERLKPYFDDGHFALICSIWTMWNSYEEYDGNTGKGEAEELLYQFITGYKTLKPSFECYAASLVQNGDLSENLLEFIKETLNPSPLTKTRH